MPDCELFERSAQPAVTMRTTIPVEKLKEFVGQAFGATIDYILRMGARPADMPFVCYRNMDLKALDVEGGIAVSQPLPAHGELLAGEVPAGQYAACMHIGSYDSLPVTYEALSRWVADQGLQPTGAVYEFYYSELTTPPEHTVTRVLFLLKA
jgi:effector-binding domain-containing protein